MPDERKLEVIARKKYALHFFIQLLDFSLETSEDKLNPRESLEKNVEVVWKNEGYTSAQLLQISFHKAYSQ